VKAKLCFFDDYYVAARPKTVRRTFAPQKLGEFHDAAALLQLYTSFFYDPSVNRFRLYYEAPIPGKGTEVRRLFLAEAAQVSDFLSGNVIISAVCGLDEEHGIHGCSVIRNPEAPDANHRYLLLGNAYADDRDKRYFMRAFSADGIAFSEMAPVYPAGQDYKDTYNSVCYNPYRHEYFATTRVATMDRRIAYIRSRDGVHWTDPELLLHPLSTANIGTQHYALGVSHLNGIFYGLLWRFLTDLDQPDFTDMGGFMENDLLYSYDGHCFISTDCAPVCKRPPEPEYGCKQLWLMNMEEAGDRYILCGGASRIAHGSSYAENDKFATTVFYDIRRDGFCALEGTGKDSVVYTKPIYFEGGEIALNCDASQGSVSVALIAANGNGIDGFGFDDCIAFSGKDCVNGKLSFRSASLDSLVGKRLRFAIRLENARLYSITFEGRPFIHRDPQYSFNDPRPMKIN